MKSAGLGQSPSGVVVVQVQSCFGGRDLAARDQEIDILRKAQDTQRSNTTVQHRIDTRYASLLRIKSTLCAQRRSSTIL